MTTQLFIAAGGKGERMGAHTVNTPKSLVKVDGKPIITHIIETADQAQVDQIVVGIDQGKQRLIDQLPKHIIVQNNCFEPLTSVLFKSAKSLQPDIICGSNGDTIYYSESLIRTIELLSTDKNAAGALLLTNVVRPLKSSNWRYWHHKVSNGLLIDMEEIPGHLIKTEYIVSAYRTSAIQELTNDFTEFYDDWQNMPFKCYSLGWDYILRIMLWKQYRILGEVTDHLCLNINYARDLEDSQYFFSQPERFRKVRTSK